MVDADSALGGVATVHLRSTDPAFARRFLGLLNTASNDRVREIILAHTEETIRGLSAGSGAASSGARRPERWRRLSSCKPPWRRQPRLRGFGSATALCPPAVRGRADQVGHHSADRWPGPRGRAGVAARASAGALKRRLFPECVGGARRDADIGARVGGREGRRGVAAPNAHARQLLEAVGLEADRGDRQRFVLTPQFRANYEFVHSVADGGALVAIAQMSRRARRA